MKTQCPVEEMRWLQGQSSPFRPHLRTSVCKSSPLFLSLICMCHALGQSLNQVRPNEGRLVS